MQKSFLTDCDTAAEKWLEKIGIPVSDVWNFASMNYFGGPKRTVREGES